MASDSSGVTLSFCVSPEGFDGCASAWPPANRIERKLANANGFFMVSPNPLLTEKVVKRRPVTSGCRPSYPLVTGGLLQAEDGSAQPPSVNSTLPIQLRFL